MNLRVLWAIYFFGVCIIYIMGREIKQLYSARTSLSEAKVEENIYFKECVFCQISQGKAPCHKVWENEKYLAFLSIYPNTKGITVVIPKSHQDSYIFNQTNNNISDIMLVSKEVAKLLVDKFETVGRIGVVFEGYGVDHLHVKLFPLHGTKGPWRAIKSQINTKYKVYPGYISTHDVARVADKELEAIARFLRGE